MPVINTLADFPADRFAIYANCACGHSAQMDTSALPLDIPMDTLHAKMRCSVCDACGASIRIAWTMEGGFRYGSGQADESRATSYHE